MRKIYPLFIFLYTFVLQAQPTMGLLSYEPEKTYEGYNLIYPHNQPNVYLFNNCGEVVHVWEDSIDIRPGNTAYLQPDGRLVKAKRPNVVVNDRIWAGGGGATVEIRDWENNLEWSFTLNNDTARLHHDIEVLPNGNILMIAWELKTVEEAIEAGRDTALLQDSELWADFILEVSPALDSIIWEWHVWDHMIQDYDSTKANYGVVADHPQLFNLNFVRDGTANWMHSNAIAFNADLNQIVVSSPFLSEIYIIDHSTTRSQAASHVGGLSGRGGDLMYRWGNPQAYGQGTADDQRSFFQHDVHWLEQFVAPSHPQYGKLALFNNEFAEGSYSQISVIQPPWDMYSWAYTLENGKWGPANYDLNFGHPDTLKMYSSGLSSVQLLSNNNYLICSGRDGYSFELTPDQEVVWEYKTPLRGGNCATQGDTLIANENQTFRIKRYPVDYAAFEGRDLTPLFYLELNPDSTFCDMILPVGEVGRYQDLQIYPNPASTQLNISWKTSAAVDVRIFDLQSRLMKTLHRSSAQDVIDVSDMAPGLYLVKIGNGPIQKLVVTR
ncbi:MAG: aryl-sulfate sulfotransferase [Saprospiraceae bacterium]|nr:aryl-sulfate sulfotransferase [Saprospiraceae bacterium]